MGVTVVVVVLVIVAILRWIEHLSTLGSLDDSLREVVKIHRSGIAAICTAARLWGGFDDT